jgi:amino acid transporter
VTNQNAFRVMCKALALAAGIALLALIYGLYVIGVSPVGFLFGFSTALLILALIAFGAVITQWDGVKHAE